MSKVYVLWSGGLDSTYMIQSILENYPEMEVVAGYVSLNNNRRKTECELRAIKKLERILKRRYGSRFEYLGVVLDVYVHQASDPLPLIQVAAWLGAIMMTLPAEIDQIALGYVMNDCAISFLDDIEAVIKAYGGLLFSGAAPPLWFPLTKTSKFSILDTIHPELLQHVFTCEMPKKGKACGKCQPCKRHRSAKQDLDDYRTTEGCKCGYHSHNTKKAKRNGSS